MPGRRARAAGGRRRTAGVLAAALLLGSVSALASDDEPTNLRVARSGAADITLTWTAPVLGADSYNVRRCLLPFTRNPTYGNCIATGLVAETHLDAAPGGDVFYLVTAETAGLEGSLGESFDGATRSQRLSPACGAPTGPGTLSIALHLDSAVSFCGAQIVLRFDASAAAYLSSQATGIQAGFIWTPNATVPGQLRAASLTVDLDAPAVGPGEFARVHFGSVTCPLDARHFELVQCGFVDCNANGIPGPACRVEVLP